MTDPYRQIARQRLDAKLEPWRQLPVDPPSGGWIRTLREALGMSLTDLARALDVTPAAVRKYEDAERAGTIQLSTLRRVAAVLGADVRYALVPAGSLEQRVRERAQHVAQRELADVNHTMALEQQQPTSAADAELIAERAKDLIDTRRLWSDR